MDGPIVFISHNRIKDGKLEALRGSLEGGASMIEREKPGTVVFLSYLDEDGAEAHIVHVFPDAEAMARHLEGADERVAKARELIETVGYELYGSPPEGVLQQMRRFAAEFGASLEMRPDYVAGYLRPAK